MIDLKYIFKREFQEIVFGKYVFENNYMFLYQFLEKELSFIFLFVFFNLVDDQNLKVVLGICEKNFYRVYVIIFL